MKQESHDHYDIGLLNTDEQTILKVGNVLYMLVRLFKFNMSTWKKCVNMGIPDSVLLQLFRVTIVSATLLTSLP